jgi:hypothetical protein
LAAQDARAARAMRFMCPFMDSASLDGIVGN